MAGKDVRNACLCGAIVAAAFLIVNPFAEMPFDDDWSYAFTVHKLLETGHIIYNGWATAAIITQVYWGAAWAKIFGFSFTTLRFSTLPFAAGSAVVCFLLARLSGLRPAPAIFAASLLGLSPMFLPLATSFMTDVPGLFFMLLSTYALAKAAAMRRTGWLAMSVMAGIAGGMSRQVVWIVPILIIPYLLWINRKDRHFSVAAVVGWIVVLIDIIATQHWFSKQHGVVIEPPLMTCLQSVVSNFWVGMERSRGFILSLFLLTLPASFSLVILVGNACRKSERLLLLSFLVGAAIVLMVHLHPDLLQWPWSPNIIWPGGILINYELSGHPPSDMPPWIVTAWSVIVFIALGASLVPLLDFVTRRGKVVKLARKIVAPENDDVVLIIMAIVGIAYLLLLVARSFRLPDYDRYTLPLVPIVTIFTLVFVQRSFAESGIRRFTFAICSIILVFYSAFSVAATRDLFALARARLDAVKMLRGAGVEPTAIAAGLEYDCWLQLELEGQVNCSRASNLNHPFDPKRDLTPALCCLYRVEYDRCSDTAPSRFLPVHYNSWLPPFHRAIHVDKFTNPWWYPHPPPEDRFHIPVPGFEIVY
jgi:Dolichyl-phosphate-mannose-protein mannosyltransferase